MSMIDSYELDELREKAAIFDFVLACALDNDGELSQWGDNYADGVQAPKTIEEGIKAFSDMVSAAKAAGVYPVKTS